VGGRFGDEEIVTKEEITTRVNPLPDLLFVSNLPPVTRHHRYFGEAGFSYELSSDSTIINGSPIRAVVKVQLVSIAVVNNHSFDRCKGISFCICQYVQVHYLARIHSCHAFTSVCFFEIIVHVSSEFEHDDFLFAFADFL